MPKPLHEGEPALTQPTNEKFLKQESEENTLSIKERFKGFMYGLGTPIHPTVSVSEKKYENGES